MFLLHRREEGRTNRPGLNFTWDKFSKPTVTLYIRGPVHKYLLYVRRRSDFVFNAAGNQRPNFYRWIVIADRQRYNLSIDPNKQW